MAGKSKTRTVHRSAITGKFVKKGTAKRHPKTTVTERVKKGKNSQRKGSN